MYRVHNTKEILQGQGTTGSPMQPKSQTPIYLYIFIAASMDIFGQLNKAGALL